MKEDGRLLVERGRRSAKLHTTKVVVKLVGMELREGDTKKRPESKRKREKSNLKHKRRVSTTSTRE